MGRLAILSGVGLCLVSGCFGPSDPFDFPVSSFGPSPRPLEGVVLAPRTPPPLAGGTLTAAEDRPLVVVSDPDRDVVWIVNTETGTLAGEIALRVGDEPGRIVETEDGDFHVVLRGAGQVARIDAETATLEQRRPVCAAPRGIDAFNGSLYVACEGGELVGYPVGGGDAFLETVVERDLRDVVVVGSQIFVSRFRSAQVLRLDMAGQLVAREVAPPTITQMEAAVAWRMVEHPDGGVLVVHQRTRDGSNPVPTTPAGGYYGDGDCSTAIVMGGLTHVGTDGTVVHSQELLGLVLPVDLAIDGDMLAFASAGNRNDSQTSAAAVALTLAEVRSNRLSSTCSATSGMGFLDGRQVVAADFDNAGRLVVQSRDPWEIVVAEVGSDFGGFSARSPERLFTVALPGLDLKDTGHDLFHEDTGAGLACASCHAEGADDGVTWVFDLGPRRTQDMRGGLLGSEPLHWSGDMATFDQLAAEVFSGRMAGPELPSEHVTALAGWIDALPAPAPAATLDVGAVDRGRALFAETGCTECHNGARFTNNETVDVGTGEAFQVPSLLGVGLRAPLMHDGCAPTLEQRFTDPSCGGGDAHGTTGHLSAAEIGDLVAYLETL